MNIGVGFEEFCHNHGIVINHVGTLTTKVRGFCYYDGNSYHVILNNKMSHDQLRRTTVHEIIHVLQNHFSCPVEDAWQAEKEVSDMIKVMELVFI